MAGSQGTQQGLRVLIIAIAFTALIYASAGPDAFVAEPDCSLNHRFGRGWAGDGRPAKLYRTDGQPADRCGPCVL